MIIYNTIMPKEFKLFSNITMIKSLAIFYITIIYSMGGVWLAAFADKYLLHSYYHTQTEEGDMSTLKHFYETIITLAVLSVLAYIGRNILQKIPFPLDGKYGFHYKRVPEVISGSLLIWVIFIFSGVLDRKIKIMNIRLSDLPLLLKK